MEMCSSNQNEWTLRQAKNKWGFEAKLTIYKIPNVNTAAFPYVSNHLNIQDAGSVSVAAVTCVINEENFKASVMVF